MSVRKQSSSSSFFLILLSIAIIFTIVFSLKSSLFLLGGKAAGATISNFRAENTTPTETFIRWESSSPTSGLVVYNTISSTFSGKPLNWREWRSEDRAITTSHAVRIGGLQPGKTYYFRVAGTIANPVEVIVSPNIVTVTTPNTPRFVNGPNISYNQKIDGPNNYHASVNWQTDVPADFIAGYNSNSSVLDDVNPANWVNEWGGRTGWTGRYLNAQSSSTYQPTYGTKYYFRIASKDQAGKMVISGKREIYLPVAVTPTPKPNCCGYNNAFQAWGCYTGCYYGESGANQSVTTLYPDQICSVASTCHF